MTWRGLAFVLLASVALFAGMASAHVVSDHEIATLRALPHGLVEAVAAGDEPDSAGWVGANRGGPWRGVSPQSAAMLLLADGAARGDTVRAERAWRAIDAAFAHQDPAGWFEHATGDRSRGNAGFSAVAVRDDARGVSDWLGELGRGLIAVMNSPLHERFSWRHALLARKRRHALDALAAESDSLERVHAHDAGFLLSEARTFTLAGGMEHDDGFERIGRRSLAAALALQRGDGAFSIDGHPDPDGQARALMALEEIVEYFSTPAAEHAANDAASWLSHQVDAHGRFGKASSEGPPAQRNVVIALAFHAQRTGDALSRAASERGLAFLLESGGR